MLSASELARIQADAQKAVCDKPCVINRKTRTADGMGSTSEAWKPVSATGLMAGLSEPTAGELQNYDYIIGDKAAWKVHLPVGTDVQHQDHLVIEGSTLEVHVILVPRSYPALLAVLAAEIA